MKKYPIFVFLTILFVIFSAPVSAASSSPLNLRNSFGNRQYDATIEKQTWTNPDGSKYRVVVNPTPCTWDINDHSDYTSFGDVAPSYTTSFSDCHIFSAEPLYACYYGMCAWWSGSDNWLGFQTSAKSADILTNLCFDTLGKCFSPVPVYDKNSRLYVTRFCVHAIYGGNPYDAAMVEIPDSGGGIGVRTNWTIKVAGTQTKGTVRNVWVQWGVSSDQFYPKGCDFVGPDGNSVSPRTQPHQSDYPWVWVIQ